jgi:diguanylate cyclase (GGDEF)-like protein
VKTEQQPPAKAVLEAKNAEPGHDRRRHAIRVFALAGWGVVLALQLVETAGDPSVANTIVAGAFLVLFVLVNLQLLLVRWLGHRSWRRVTSKLHGSAYLSEFHNLPNRNYVLAELRREMPRSRAVRSPFVLIQLSLDGIDGVRDRRGEEFAGRAVNALADVLKRLTRSSDFLAHLGETRFCVMLVECTSEQSWTYLRRVPGSIAVSDGRQMFDVAVTARVYQYDLEAIYATDVLHEVEEMRPLRRHEEQRIDAMAA